MQGLRVQTKLHVQGEGDVLRVVSSLLLVRRYLTSLGLDLGTRQVFFTLLQSCSVYFGFDVE